jgi:hypothetical protein
MSADDGLVGRLTQTGIAAAVAADLVSRHRDRCVEQLRYLPFSAWRVRDVAGYLRRAIENDFAPPKLPGLN